MTNLASYFQLTKRNFKIFFKNKIQVFYTLLVPIIIIVIYVLFLRTMEMGMVNDRIRGILGEQGLKDAVLMQNVSTCLDSWMIGGIIALSTITMAIQTDAIIVKDKENGINRDFASSPVDKKSLIASYFSFNFIITFMLCLIVLLICWVVLGCVGEFRLNFGEAMLTIATLAYVTIPATLITVFICTFIHHDNTLAAVVAIFSTAIGFLIGSYIPLGMMPMGAQTFFDFIPGTYSTSLLRYCLLNTPVNETTNYVMQAYPGQADSLIKEVSGLIGYNLNFANQVITPWMQSLVVLGIIVLFAILNLLTAKKLTLVESGNPRKKKVKK